MASPPSTPSETSFASRSPPTPASRRNRPSTGYATSTSSSTATARAALAPARDASCPAGSMRSPRSPASKDGDSPSTRSSKEPAPSCGGSQAGPPTWTSSSRQASMSDDEAIRTPSARRARGDRGWLQRWQRQGRDAAATYNNVRDDNDRDGDAR